MIRARKIINLGLAVLAISALIVYMPGAEPGSDPNNTGMADPEAFANAFDCYLAGLRGSHSVTIPLVSLRGFGGESQNASGNVQISVNSGAVLSTIRGLPANGNFDLWLVENRPLPGQTTLAEARDGLLRVGSYDFASGIHVLSVVLGPQRLAGFEVDRAFVVRSNQNPISGFVLTGSPTVFDRLVRRHVRFVDAPEIGLDPTSPSRTGDFAKLIAQGRRLFINETFQGNGRTCGTCHVESNNFTIDPKFIATLPANNPLFVAESNPALATLENSGLLRSLGLFIVNADGFEDLQNKFTLRATQPVLALSNSSVRPDPSFLIDFTTNGANSDPPERLGWSNDGAPLRDFALVAIIQHAPKTLNRRAGIDFRVPTDEELDALAAYQLALGRQEDFNLPALQLKSNLATTGKALYLDTGFIGEPGHKNCNACHLNGGGTTGISLNDATPGFSPKMDQNARGFNMTAGTNTNATPLAISLGLKRDGGFGVLPTPLGAFGNFADIPGVPPFPVEEFNSPSVVESADTGPFFHNHSAPDLESSVAFYGTPAFQEFPISIGSPGAPTPINISPNPNDPEVLAIAALLRVLNALENIRSSLNLAERAKKMATDADARDLAALAVAEVEDATQVLSEGAYASTSEAAILAARAELIAARNLLVAAAAQSRPAIEGTLVQAAARLRTARAALVNPATLPPSFRN